MTIDTNRVAAYLAGSFSPYYQAFSKIEFILLLSSKAGGIFTDEKFQLIERHTSSLQQFYAESLNLLKNQQELLLEIVDVLNVPFEAKGKDFVAPRHQQDIKIDPENQKTIGFITPFDDEMKVMESFIRRILKRDYSGWNIKTASLGKDGTGRFLWSSIKDFLEKYPVYIADFRDQNLNVSLEVGYLLGKFGDDAKIIIILDENVKISDLSGMIRVAKKANNTMAGKSPSAAAKVQTRINKELGKNLKEQFKRYLE